MVGDRGACEHTDLLACYTEALAFVNTADDISVGLGNVANLKLHLNGLTHGCRVLCLIKRQIAYDGSRTIAKHKCVAIPATGLPVHTLEAGSDAFILPNRRVRLAIAASCCR